MKNVFATRALKAYWDLMGDFADSLQTTFPECADTQDWCLYVKNVVIGDEARMSDGFDKWRAGISTPLKKAKYAKAVQSITGRPATVYHALYYRDMESADTSFEALQSLSLPGKVKGMEPEQRAIFWQYIDEFNRLAHEGHCDPPSVPSTDEIAADIARRRSTPVLQHGLADVWAQLCGNGCACDAAKLSKAAAEKADEEGETTGDLCRARDPGGLARLRAHFPELPEDFGDERWALLDKALGLACMEDAIPAPMMRGIESVAQQLVQDLASGKTDPSSLNLEAIGQQVLTSVSPDEMSAFAGNLDKILPALERLQR